MSPLRIDFGPRRRSVLRLGGYLLFGLGGVLAAHEAWRYADLFKARKVLEAENNRLQHLIDSPVIPSLMPAASASKESLARIAQTIDRLNAPWAALFNGVESAVNADVILLGMDPDLQLREVRLRAEARNVDAMLQFVRHIDKVEVLKKPYLDNYQVHLQDPQRPVRFTLVAQWNVNESRTEKPRVAP